jgi:hypothetical protein
MTSNLLEHSVEIFKMLRFAFIGLTLSLLASTYAIAEIYKTVDKNGRVTFSDTPPANTNAKPIELKSINTTPPPTAMPNPVTQDTSNLNTQAAQAYDVQIIAPTNGTTLMVNDRSVLISVSVNQNLQNDDVFAYKIDGNIIAKTTEFSFTLSEPPRGEHVLTVDVIDKEDKSLAQSNAITLLVMRPLAKQVTTPVPKK